MEDRATPSDEYHPTLASPEGILMLFFAALIYIAGFVCLALDVFFGIGEVPRLIVDIISTIVLGGWMLARGGTPQVGSKLKQFVKKRLGWMVAEDIPFVGDLFPGDIVATLGFLTQQNQPAYAKAISNTAKISRVVALLFLLLPPLKSFAAEISYPPFFAIDKATSIGDLVKIFYSAALGIGALFAAGYLIFLGFQILTSRGRPGKMLDIRKRIGQILAGLAILAGSILILRTINPELPSLRIGTFSFGTISPLPAGPTVPVNTGQGQKFDSYSLGRTLDATNIFLNKIDLDPHLAETENTLVTLVKREGVVNGDLSQCSQNLCEGPGTPTPYSKSDTCYNPATGTSSPCCSTASCSSNVCNGYAPGRPGEPCPERNDAINKLTQSVPIFIDVQNFYNNVIQPERNKLENCSVAARGGNVLIDYVSAQHVAQSYGQNLDATFCRQNPDGACHESEDYFCLNAVHTFVHVHLSLNEPTTGEGLVQKEQKFIDNVNAAVSDINSCSCTNAQYYCPNSGQCDDSYGHGLCVENSDSSVGQKGCTPQMWPDLLAFSAVGNRMNVLHDQLYGSRTSQGGTEGAINEIDAFGQYVKNIYTQGDDPNKYFYFGTCLDTQTVAELNPTCPNNSTSTGSVVCCPDKNSRADIHQCVIEDFYDDVDCAPSASSAQTGTGSP